jgi:PEP-CTERM motif
LVLVKTNNTGVTISGFDFTYSSVSSAVTTPLGLWSGTYNGATAPPTFTRVSDKVSSTGSFSYRGELLNGETVAFYIPVSFATAGSGTFTIDQTSIVPEPSSIALMGLGGIGLAIGAYRRRRASV